MKVDFLGLKNLGLRIWNLGIPVCLAMLFVLMLLIASDFLYNIHKDYGEKEY